MQSNKEKIILLFRFGLGSIAIAELTKIPSEEVEKVVREEIDRKFEVANGL